MEAIFPLNFGSYLQVGDVGAGLQAGGNVDIGVSMMSTTVLEDSERRSLKRTHVNTVGPGRNKYYKKFNTCFSSYWQATTRLGARLLKPLPSRLRLGFSSAIIARRLLFSFSCLLSCFHTVTLVNVV